MKPGNFITLMLTSALLLLSGAAAAAADKQELQARFEKRYPQILEYKTSGKAGETTRGLLEIVDPKFKDDAKLAKLVDEENTDRRELYELLAKEEGTTSDKVAERTARRNYSKARAGEYLQTASGEWKRKT